MSRLAPASPAFVAADVRRLIFFLDRPEAQIGSSGREVRQEAPVESLTEPRRRRGDEARSFQTAKHPEYAEGGTNLTADCVLISGRSLSRGSRFLPGFVQSLI